MRLPITPQTTLLRDLRTQLRQQAPAGRVIVAVDGFPETDTAAFADTFAAIIGEDDSAVFRASMADFLRPRAERGPGAAAPGSFDLDALHRALLDPFRDRADTAATTGFQLGVWDWRRDRPSEAKWTTAPEDAVLVVDGPFLLPPDLRGAWNWSVTLEVAESVFAGRTGRSADAPYSATEFAYLRSAQPLRWASAIVDVTDPADPRQVYRDFC